MDANKLATRIADYAERPAATADACARAIKAERLEYVVCCRGPDNKPRTFEQAFKEIFGRAME